MIQNQRGVASFAREEAYRRDMECMLMGPLHGQADTEEVKAVRGAKSRTRTTPR